MLIGRALGTRRHRLPESLVAELISAPTSPGVSGVGPLACLMSAAKAVPVGGWLTRLTHCPAMTTENTRQSETAPMPMPAVAFVPARLPKNRIRRNDAAMMAGTIQTLSRMLGITSASALQEIDVVGVDALAVAVDHQHEGEADTDLGG